MDLFEAIYGRRSIRKYLKKPIPKDAMMKILDVARWAPSSCNRQLWEFVTVTKPEIKKRIADEACFGQRFLKEAPSLVVVFYDDTKERREETGPRKHDSIQSAAAAIQNMNLAAYSMGVGSLWVCSIKKMLVLNKILNVPESIRPIAIVAFGYPAEKPMVPKRRSIESFVHYEKFHQLEGSYGNSTDPQKWSLNELTTFRERICWYGGTIDPENTLEKYSMRSSAYSKIMVLVKDYASNPENKILDILPFGGGYLIGMLKEINDSQRVYAFELSEGNVNYIKENLKVFKLPEPHFVINNDTKLSIKLDNLDVVTCFFRLEKVPDPKMLLNEIHRVLKIKGNLLLATELKGISEFHEIIRNSKDKNLHTSHLWSTGPSIKFSRNRLNKMLKESNFKIIRQEVFRENGFIKSIAKQILRSEGITLISVLEKQ